MSQHGATLRGGGLRMLPATLLLLTAAAFAAAQPADRQPPPRPATIPASREEHVQMLFDYVTREYVRQLASKDWITRSIAAISLARVPTPAASDAILKHLRQEPEPVGQLVAWQALLARAPLLSDGQFAAWRDATGQMIRKDLFHGDLRIGLLEMLSSTPADAQERAYFRKLFEDTSSLDSSDVPTLIAMGRAVRAWGDEALVRQLIGSLDSPNTAVRAELILQAAGAEVPWNRTPDAQREYTKWWQDRGKDFTAAATAAPDGWKKLLPQFVAPPADAASIDPMDRTWREDLELGELALRMFDFAISIDCSQSMRPEIERLKRDMRIMFTAFSLISREPRVGLTLFSPGGLVKCMPLTGDPRRLMAAVKQADIFGPTGDEEWAGGLEHTIRDSRWNAPGQYSKRAIVMISDEPIAPEQGRRCLKIAEAAGKEDFRIYSVMIHSAGGRRNNPLSIPFDRSESNVPRSVKRGPSYKAGSKWSTYEDIAQLTHARAIDALIPQGGFGLGGPIGADKDTRNESPVAIAPIYRGGGPTNRILTQVLVDAINPQYAERVEPFVKILVAYCQKAAERTPERRKWGKPDKMEPNLK